MDTESFVDQFDSGERGCNDDQSPSDGATFCGSVTTAGTEGLSGANVTYVNTFAGRASKPGTETESPVLDITAVNTSPDNTWTIPAITANTRSGATSPNYACVVGDDGGFNSLGFGEWDDQHYQMLVDVYLPFHGSLNNANNEFVRFGIAVRVQKDLNPANPHSEESPVEGPGNISRQYGCYALLYDSSEGKVYPTKILPQPTPTATFDDIRDKSLTNAGTTSPQVLEFLGSGITVTEGWHTLGIRASGSDLKFTVDETNVDVTDSDYSSGKAALFYRTSPTGTYNATYDHAGRFDNLRVDPAPTPTPIPTPTPLAVDSSWSLYE
jgi:hypothetical protein